MTTVDPLAPLERWITATLETLEPRQRKAILAKIGRGLRQRNQRRISRQTGPDGEAWTPRKRDTAGKVRSTAKMLQGLRAARRLTLKAGPDGVEVGYYGRTARIAAVHNYGEVDAVEPGGPVVKYPARPLLGVAEADMDFVRKSLLDALENAG